MPVLEIARDIEESDPNVVRIHNYPVPTDGVNLNASIVELAETECIQSKNCVVRNGWVKRGGSAKYVDAEVVSDKAILGLHKFYYNPNSSQLLVVCDTIAKRLDGTSWTNIKTGLTTAKNTRICTWGPLQKAYFANGHDIPHKWDGSSSTAVSGTDYPTKAIQFLPYRDRLLHIDANKPGYLGWSKSFTDSAWESVTNIGVRPDSQLYGMLLHSNANVNVGEQAKVLLAGADSMHLFSGELLGPPFVVGNYRVDALSIRVGCNAPRSMVWTPAGSMWLGLDREVYMLPFNSNVPVPMGSAIRSLHHTLNGIESIPKAQIQNACAVYHDGFYKLAFASSGQTTNDTQFWLDITRLHQNKDKLWGPWYGPMKGMETAMFANFAGPGDAEELLYGEHNASTGGFVHQTAQSGVYTDNDVNIDVIIQTYFNPCGDPSFMKNVERMEAEMLNTTGDISMELHDIDGLYKRNLNFIENNTLLKWGEEAAIWNTFYWQSNKPTRREVQVPPPARMRRVSVIVKQNIGTDKFELYSFKAKVHSDDVAFDT